MISHLMMAMAGRTQRKPLSRKNRRGTVGPYSASLLTATGDVDGHAARARAAGAQIIREPKTSDYGDDYWADRSYGALDPEGHMWWISQRIR